MNPSINIHLTNITGLGATQLVLSLVPELLKFTNVENMYLPSSGILTKFANEKNNKIYKRILPNNISRFLECTFFSFKFDSNIPIIVLGDLPLRTRCKQILLIQTPHLFPLKSNKLNFNFSLTKFKFLISRLIFHLNFKFIDQIIVQTEVMKSRILSYYPKLEKRISVIPNPVPNWIPDQYKKIYYVNNDNKKNLKLIYPAAGYSHKNHDLLLKINDLDQENVTIILTLRKISSKFKKHKWIINLGQQTSSQLLNEYLKVDGLIFLSNDESYGFPLIEAMYLGLPIICPDLPYAKILCGDNAIYYRQNDVDSIVDSIKILRNRLDNQWTPDWSNALSKIPKSWEIVAKSYIKLLY